MYVGMLIVQMHGNNDMYMCLRGAPYVSYTCPVPACPIYALMALGVLQIGFTIISKVSVSVHVGSVVFIYCSKLLCDQFLLLTVFMGCCDM